MDFTMKTHFYAFIQTTENLHDIVKWGSSQWESMFPFVVLQFKKQRLVLSMKFLLFILGQGWSEEF